MKKSIKRIVGSICAGFVAALMLSTGALSQTRPPSVPGGAGGLTDELDIPSINLVTGHPDYNRTRQTVTLGRTPAPVTAVMQIHGGGVIHGHWELAIPADGAPSSTDLTPEPLLNAEGRLNRRRFKRLSSFDISVSPGERYLLEGPRLSSRDFTLLGRYFVVMRIDSANSYGGTNTNKLPRTIPPVEITVVSPR